MSAPATRLEPPRALSSELTGTRSTGWWGMVWLIATEATLFATLIISYFYIRFQTSPVWPPDGIAIPTLELPLIMTALLLSSSIPMHIADRGIKKGRQGRLKAGLALAFVLGAVFLGLQAYEYVEKLREFTPQTNAYGSLFFTITGFHGTHVFVGLVMNAGLQIRAWKGRYGEHNHGHVENVALYWHFVDAVWVFVLASLYLSPNY